MTNKSDGTSKKIMCGCRMPRCCGQVHPAYVDCVECGGTGIVKQHSVMTSKNEFAGMSARDLLAAAGYKVMSYDPTTFCFIYFQP